jgi:NAD(P)-dependent dehydrogenase (short-subunit alcohol dehydrogenase family)/acyl carrier protein
VNIIRVLVELQLTQKAKLWVITKHVQNPEEKSRLAAIRQSPLWGLGRAAALEYPDLWGGLIDIDDKIMDTRTAAILREIAAGQEEQVCLREDGKRYVARLDKIIKGNDSPAAAGDINPDGTYLITGGQGALGLEMARWLVNKGCGHLVLTSRSSPTDAVQTVIDELNRDGANVIVKTGDVSREADVLGLLGEIRETMPPLRGIIHAAGVLDDGMLAEQNWERFQRVFAPKVQGAWNLHRASRDMPLDMFVMFSSAAAWMGSPGQANYAAANEFLNSLARYRKSRGLPALSINWGPWAGKGMAARTSRRGDRLSGRGIYSIQPQDGLNILEKLLAADSIPSCVMAADMDWTSYRRYMLHKQETGLFSRMIDRSTAGQSASLSGKEENLMTELKTAPPPERHKILLARVRKLAGKVMGYESHQQVIVDKPLVEQGADSLMAVEMRNRLGESLGIMLSVTLLYDHPSLEKITAFLLNDVLSFEGAPENNKPADGKKKKEQSTEELLDEINTLLES